MYNHNKAQQSKDRVHISWDILYDCSLAFWFMSDLELLQRNIVSVYLQSRNKIAEISLDFKYSYELDLTYSGTFY